MGSQAAFGAAFLAALIFLAYCLFTVPPAHLDMAVDATIAGPHHRQAELRV